MLKREIIRIDGISIHICTSALAFIIFLKPIVGCIGRIGYKCVDEPIHEESSEYIHNMNNDAFVIQLRLIPSSIQGLHIALSYP